MASSIALSKSPSKFSVPASAMMKKDEDKSKFLREVLQAETPHRILVDQLAHTHLELDTHPEVGVFFSTFFPLIFRQTLSLHSILKDLPAILDTGAHGRRATPTFPVSEELQLRVSS